MLERCMALLDAKQGRSLSRANAAGVSEEALEILEQELEQWQRLVRGLRANSVALSCPGEMTHIQCYEGDHAAEIARVGPSVCQILLRESAAGQLRPVGSGAFVKTPGLILTAGHVVPADCSALVLRFRFQDPCGKPALETVDFPVESCTDVRPDGLDFALVHAGSNADGQRPEDICDAAPLGTSLGLQVDEPTICIQHPLGQPKQVSLGKFVSTRDAYIRYTNPTDRLSSGSPVLNAQGQIVAVHHGPDDIFACAKLGLGIDEIINVSSEL